MKISTRGRYALRMLIDLAERRDEGYISLRDIAERQKISRKYLEQIVPILNKTGILKASRGAQGGYRLAKPAEQCTLGEILRAAEGGLATVACLDGENYPCQRQADCPALPVWQGLNELIDSYLDGITLQDVLNNHRKEHGGGPESAVSERL